MTEKLKLQREKAQLLEILNDTSHKPDSRRQYLIARRREQYIISRLGLCIAVKTLIGMPVSPVTALLFVPANC